MGPDRLPNGILVSVEAQRASTTELDVDQVRQTVGAMRTAISRVIEGKSEQIDLAIMVLLGILANALVCGGISQPSTRYGARVIWLLPLMVTIAGRPSGIADTASPTTARKISTAGKW